MPTFTQIGSAVVVGSGGQAAIDFTSIPSTYTDLVLKLSARATSLGGNVEEVLIAINGSSANQTTRGLFGTGASAGSQNVTKIMILADGSGATASTFGNAELYIPNYAGSTNKSMSSDSVSETNGTSGWQYLNASLWSQTAAITSISLTIASSTFAQHSTAYLYGVSNA
jgi:hypothetical protein